MLIEGGLFVDLRDRKLRSQTGEFNCLALHKIADAPAIAFALIKLDAYELCINEENLLNRWAFLVQINLNALIFRPGAGREYLYHQAGILDYFVSVTVTPIATH